MLQVNVLSKDIINRKRLEDFFKHGLEHCEIYFYEEPNDLLEAAAKDESQLVIIDKKNHKLNVLRQLDKALSKLNVVTALVMPENAKVDSERIFRRYPSVLLVIIEGFDSKTLLSFLKLLNTSRCNLASNLEPLSTLDLININTNSVKYRHNMFEILNNTNEGIWLWDIEENKIYLSELFKESLGYEKDQLCDDIEIFVNMIHPEDKKLFRQSVSEYLNHITSSFDLELRFRNQDGSYRWFLLRGYATWDKSGKPVKMITVQMDFDGIKKRIEKLENLALYDLLTGLPNRSLLYDRIHTAIVNSSRNHMMLGLLFIDLDDFKSINDNYGHTVGDIVLKKTAKRLKDSVRKIDTVSRLHGDEFIVVVPLITKPDDINKFTDRIKKAFKRSMRIKNQDLAVSCSIGFSIYPKDGNTIEDLLEKADASMYKRKNMYKNLYSTQSK